MSFPSSVRSAGLALLASATLSLPCAAKADGALDAYLPKSGKIVGHVMKLGVAQEDQAIDKQFRVAVQNNMEWFKKHVQGQKSGEPLPYDKRMGITEAQYNKLQHMKADFRPGDPIEISVGKNADGTVSFSSNNAEAAELNKVTFPADEKVAATPYGKLAIFNQISQTDAKAPIGEWTGAEWAKVEEKGAPMPSAKIAFGKRTPSGEGVMYYQVAAYGTEHTEKSLVIFYKLD